AGVADGCYVPVVFRYNLTSVTTTTSITADGSPCKHPWQLSLNDMKTLDAGRAILFGAINLATAFTAVTSAAGSRSESASMSLTSIDAAGVAAYFTPSPPSSPGCTAVSPTLSGSFGAILAGDFSGLVTGPPDIGSSIDLLNSGRGLHLAGGP